MIRIKFLVLCVLLGSCGGPRAVYDYDTQIDFSHYKTYSLDSTSFKGLSSLDVERLLRSLETHLGEVELSLVENGDLLLQVEGEEFFEERDEHLGIGLGGGGGMLGVGVSGRIPIGGTERFLILTFTFIAGGSDSVVWQAVVKDRFEEGSDPEEREERLDRMVFKAFQEYPPGK